MRPRIRRLPSFSWILSWASILPRILPVNSQRQSSRLKGKPGRKADRSVLSLRCAGQREIRRIGRNRLSGSKNEEPSFVRVALGRLNFVDCWRQAFRRRTVLSSEREILQAINRFYEQSADTPEEMIQSMDAESSDRLLHDLEEIEDLLDVSDEAPVIKLVNLILFQAVKERASDIHIEPYQKELKVRYRIDG